MTEHDRIKNIFSVFFYNICQLIHMRAFENLTVWNLCHDQVVSIGPLYFVGQHNCAVRNLLRFNMEDARDTGRYVYRHKHVQI